LAVTGEIANQDVLRATVDARTSITRADTRRLVIAIPSRSRRIALRDALPCDIRLSDIGLPVAVEIANHEPSDAIDARTRITGADASQIIRRLVIAIPCRSRRIAHRYAAPCVVHLSDIGNTVAVEIANHERSATI